MIKPLVFIPSPRDLSEFASATKLLPYDKLWVKYYPEIHAYYHARNWFLDHEEYTHLIILPDDLIVKPEHIERLLDDITIEGCDVISGYCKNTIRQMWNYQGPPEREADSNISLIPPPNPPISGTYSQYNFMSIRFIHCLLATNENIIKIKYAGFPPTVIDRQIVTEIPFRSEFCCVDSCFSIDLDKANIDQYCDLRVRTEHMELRQDGPPDLQVGKKEASIIFEKGIRV
jgi:hypothetical protein